MTNFDTKIQDFASAIVLAAEKQALKKAVFSKSNDKSIIKTVLTLKSISGKLCLQAESFHTDNKAKHENIYMDENAVSRLCSLIDGYAQVNLITTAGECEYKSSKSGKITLIGVSNLVNKLNANSVEKAEIGGNNQEKNSRRTKKYIKNSPLSKKIYKYTVDNLYNLL